MAASQVLRQSARKRKPQPDWETVQTALMRRAESRGYLLPDEIREELKRHGLDSRRWRDWVRRAGNLLTYNRGRYYYTPSLQAARLREEERQLHVRALLQMLLQVCKRTQNREERRAADRIEVIWPVTLILEDGTAHRALTRDISVSGIRFLSNRSLLGQKLIARLSLGEREEHAFSVRILWTCEVADGLYENGGSVLEVIRTN